MVFICKPRRGVAREGSEGREHGVRERQHQSGSVIPAFGSVKEMRARVVLCMNLP